jgi:RHS repeat-associated protein
MLMPGRKYQAAGGLYRYGFNGKEKDDEVKGEGNQQDYVGRIYDPRISRWLSVDPSQQLFPNESPYCAMGNNPIGMFDPDGKRKYKILLQYDAAKNSYTLIKITKENGLKLVTRQKYVQYPDRGGSLVYNNEWYDYQTFEVTVINGKAGVDYSAYTVIPDNILGKPRTETWDPDAPELWVQLTAGDFGAQSGPEHGVIFTSIDGESGNYGRKGFAEYSVNIYGLVAAIAGIKGMSVPPNFEIPSLPKGVEKAIELGEQLKEDFGNTVVFKKNDQGKTDAGAGGKKKERIYDQKEGKILHKRDWPANSNIKVLPDGSGQTSGEPATDTIN